MPIVYQQISKIPLPEERRWQASRNHIGRRRSPKPSPQGADHRHRGRRPGLQHPDDALQGWRRLRMVSWHDQTSGHRP